MDGYMYTEHTIYYGTFTVLESGLGGGSLDPATAMPGCYCTMPNTVDLHTLVLCRSISQELVTPGSRVGIVIFQGWEGRLWRHRRDPRGAFQRWTGPKRATFFLPG